MIGSVLAFGAQHTWPLVLATLCVGLGVLTLGPQVVKPPRELWLFVGLGAYTGFQLLPMPLGGVELLSPAAAAIWRDAFTPFGEAPPRFVPLTVDPGGTALELLKWTALACALLAAVALRASRGAHVLATLLFASALVVALFTLAHGVFDLTHVYGLFELSLPVERWSRGPLVNGNHLAGYINLGFFSGAGLLLARRGPAPRWLLAGGMLVLPLCALLAASRAGAVLLGAGGILTLTIALRRHDAPRELVLVVAGVVLCLLAVTFVALGGDRVWSELRNADLRGKSAAWVWSFDLVRDFPVFGAGRGAFETGFQPYRQIQKNDWTIVYSHPENVLVQFVAEWGIPVGLLALFAFGAVGARLVAVPGRDWVGLGLRIGLLTLVVHNLVDFSLEVFGVSLGAVVALGGVTTRVELGEARNPKTARLVVAFMAVAIVCVIALGAASSQVERRELASDYHALEAKASATELRERVRSAIGRHPAESYFYLLAALLARRDGEDPLPFLSKALERGPLNGTVHLGVASALAERGALSQALLHLRLAARYDVILRERALERVASWGREASVIARAFGEGQPGSELLSAVCPRLREAEQIACHRIVLERSGAHEKSRHSLALGLLAAAEGKRPPCVAPEPCRDEVIAVLRDASPQDWTASYLRARAVALDAEPAAAAEALLRGCPPSPEAAACAESALRHAERAKDVELVRRAAERYVTTACPGRGCAGARRAAGDAFMRLRAGGLALEQYRQAADEEPTAAAWLAVAEAARAVGSPSSARLALDRAMATGDLSPGELERARRIRKTIGTSP